MRQICHPRGPQRFQAGSQVAKLHPLCCAVVIATRDLRRWQLNLKLVKLKRSEEQIKSVLHLVPRDAFRIGLDGRNHGNRSVIRYGGLRQMVFRLICFTCAAICRYLYFRFEVEMYSDDTLWVKHLLLLSLISAFPLVNGMEVKKYVTICYRWR
jgi:hypothetical protein